MNTELPDADWKKRLRRRLLNWFSTNARDLPWRPSPGLYETWISEIMLQQTQVVTVIPFYQRFLERFPSVASLAEADQQEVLRYWEGLGYYRRARQLHAAARRIEKEHDGRFPTSIDQVRALPGIGRYTAGAILSIALDQRHPILEANTIRLLSRLAAYTGDPTRSAGQQRLWELAEALLPRRRSGDFNQAMMELGSTICTPRGPSCERCPVSSLCPTKARGMQDRIPRGKRQPTTLARREAAMVIHSNGKVLLRRCQPNERWAGLWDFPRFEVSNARGTILNQELTDRVKDLTGLEVCVTGQLTTLKHGVTRYRITLICHEAICDRRGRTKHHLRWVDPTEIAHYPLSVTGRAISQLLVTP